MISGEQKWNLNKEYLVGLSYLRMVYIQARIANDLQTMFDTLEQIEIEISAECKEDQLKLLETIRTNDFSWLNENKDKWCTRDSSGHVTHYHPKNKRNILMKFNETYRKILRIAKDAGILTYEQHNPSDAIKNMRSS